jgi:ABC-type phosphate transport system substrate-binding protein
MAESLVVIINPANPVEDLAFEDLVKIFKKEKRHWPYDGKEIYLLAHEARSKEQGMILEMIYGMDALALKKLWLTKMYLGEIPSFPKAVSSNNSMREFVKKVPSAIGIIRETYVNADVKILKIDGKLPGEDGYRLTCKTDRLSPPL